MPGRCLSILSAASEYSILFYNTAFSHNIYIYSMAPSTTKQWTIEGKSGFDALKLNESASVPKVGDKDVLVKSMYPSTREPIQTDC